ncbi:DEAD/DEAH box helicase [Aquimarina agarilytica]|uniref:DEAD/DEAH box helicase n=1 Tax=Aquimarina agarilytica TaxID=1087449 RepID=UPI000288862B|nr:DEAD/DEAH box helicase [Aquimarina agarilytica]
MSTFKTLGLGEALLQAIDAMGFVEPSEVQAKAIPILLEQDTDIVALAQTGTGKTAAFGFPLIEKIDPSSKKTQGLILSPTRELCLQIAQEIKNYSKFISKLNSVAVYGGASIHDQARDIKRGAQIIVATPGRMQDMINRGLVDISQIGYCVLDEADEMLNMGFYEDITKILSHTPDEKSTWLFSATMPREVATIAKKFMSNPVEITVGSKNSSNKNVTHEYYVVSARDRYPALKRLADANPSIFAVIFCRTKRDTQSIAEKLIEDGYSAAALHGDLSQNQRDLVMKSFRNRQIQMLVATDVAARGIDVNDITHVINYQLPDENETYNHRSGRTGRAGKEGVSIVITTKSDVRKIKSLERTLQTTFEQKTVPTGKEICKIQLFNLAEKIETTEINDEVDEYLPEINSHLEHLSKEELIKKLVTVEFTRFHNYYKKSRDIQAVDPNSKGGDYGDGKSTRFFINIGEKDGYNWMNLKDLLKETLNLGGDTISRVDVKEKFSFFNTPNEQKDAVLAAFENIVIDGRKVNIEISEGRGGGRGRGDRRGGGRRNGGGGRGGFRGDRRNSGGDRKDNYKGNRDNKDRKDRNENSGGGRDRRKRRDRY